MNIILVYMVKVAVYLTAFYLIYSLMLSRDTAYGRNRAFILLSIVASLIFPLITFQTAKPLNIQFFGKLLSEVFVTAGQDGISDPNTRLTTSEALDIIYSIYIIGVSASLFKLLIDLLNLFFLIIRQKNKGSIIITFRGFNTAGFSAMGHIFINARLSTEEAGEIIKHEQNHIRQNHFIDILFVELVKAIQWFNPAVYLFNRALRAIHEFQADHDCLCSGMAVVNYQSLLLNQVFKSKAFNLTNSFSNPSLIKMRMVMMTKKRTSALANMKLVLVIPVTAVVFLAISAYREIPDSAQKLTDQVAEFQAPAMTSSTHPESVAEVLKPSSETQAKMPVSTYDKNVTPPPPPPPAEEKKISAAPEKEEAPFVVVEEMPMFPGGDAELLKYLGENTQYPEAAKANNIQGRVIIRFCVTAKGGVSQISVLKGVSPELDAEAIRVVSTLPEFQPGKQAGKAVPVWYMVPITFTLK
jgi:TonB family protein